MRGNDQEWGSDKNRNCHSIHVLQKPLPKWFILFFMFYSFIRSQIPHFFQSSPKRSSCFDRTKGILRSQKSKLCWKKEGYINWSKWHESFLTSSHQNCSKKNRSVFPKLHDRISNKLWQVFMDKSTSSSSFYHTYNDSYSTNISVIQQFYSEAIQKQFYSFDQLFYED